MILQRLLMQLSFSLLLYVLREIFLRSRPPDGVFFYVDARRLRLRPPDGVFSCVDARRLRFHSRAVCDV